MNSAVENCPSDTASKTSQLWQIDIWPEESQPDRLAAELIADASDLRLPDSLKIAAARGFLIEGDLSRDQAQQLSLIHI